MVDHGLSIDESFTIVDKKDLRPQQLFKRQFSGIEGVRELLRKYEEESKGSVRNKHLHYEKQESEAWNLERLHEKLSKIVTEILSRSPADYENTQAAKEIRDLESSYKHVTEKFLDLLVGYLKSIKDLQKEVLKTLRQFRLVSRVAANVTLGTSVTNIFLVIVAVAQKYGKLPWFTRISLISSVVAGLSFTASLLTLSYMTQTTTDVSRDMRREKRVLLDLLWAHRKGDWIDEKVRKLFPYGIDLNFFDGKAIETSSYFENRYSWKKYLSSSIILSNVHKDVRLLESDKFLTTVKLFVESPAAEIWWSRIKIRKLLESIHQKADSLSSKQILSAHESYVTRTSLYLYPLVLPWLVSSWQGEEMRFLCSVMAGALALTDLKTDSQGGLQELKEVSANFEKDFREIETICEILDSNDD